MPSNGSSEDDLCMCGADRRAHRVIHTHVFTNDETEPCTTQFSEGPCAGARCHPGDCTPIADDIALPEPQGSASSSPDERAFCLQCRHHRRFHVGGFCEVCPGFTKDNHHDFVPADAETAEETVNRVASGGYPGAWKAGPASTLCRCGHPRFRHAEGGCSPCEIEEPEAPECIGFAEPEAPECVSPQGCHRVVACDPGCAVTARTMRAALATPPPRPPNAVAYATEGGAQFEIALSGDATVRAIDGALIITHAGAVLAITQVRPMEN